MDHDYELEDDYAPRILWGRLAFFLLALLLAFVAGRACAPNGVPEEDLQAARAQVTDLASDNAVLQQQLDRASSNGGQTGGKKNNANNNNNNNNNNGGGGGDTAEEEPTEATSEESIAEGETYEVQSGDTLTTIAEKFYNDARKFTLISDANNLDDNTGLTVGQELVIPPDD